MKRIATSIMAGIFALTAGGAPLAGETKAAPATPATPAAPAAPATPATPPAPEKKVEETKGTKKGKKGTPRKKRGNGKKSEKTMEKAPAPAKTEEKKS